MMNFPMVSCKEKGEYPGADPQEHENVIGVLSLLPKPRWQGGSSCSVKTWVRAFDSSIHI